MTLHRRPSILSHRPKTSSAADASPGTTSFEPGMKRTASQTFSPIQLDVRDAGIPLGSVREGSSVSEYPPPAGHLHTSSTSSLSRASQSIKGSYKQICRRLSSSSSRRPSLSNITDAPINPSRKSSSDPAQQPRLLLQHQDSGVPTLTQGESLVPGVHSKFAAFKRFGSIRHRRPATSGPSGDYARYNPSPVPVPNNYPIPIPMPGQAARAAAAAANNERLIQRRQEEQTSAFLSGSLQSGHAIDEVIKDSESGVGMSCSSPITQEKKLGMFATILYDP